MMVAPRNVVLSPPACGKRSMAQGAICVPTCRQGYRLQGERRAVCLSTGDWSANVHSVTCAGMCVCVCVCVCVCIDVCVCVCVFVKALTP